MGFRLVSASSILALLAINYLRPSFQEEPFEAYRPAPARNHIRMRFTFGQQKH